jgi:hypothetical protein
VNVTAAAAVHEFRKGWRVVLLAATAIRRELAVGSKPRRPFVRVWESFDLIVEIKILPGIEEGSLSRDDMIGVVAAQRCWEVTGDLAHAAY